MENLVSSFLISIFLQLRFAIFRRIAVVGWIMGNGKHRFKFVSGIADTDEQFINQILRLY